MSTAGQPGLGASEAPQKYRSRSSSSSSSTSSSSAASSRSSSLTRHHNARGPSARAAQTNGSTAKPHVSMRDRIAAELHERFPSQAISGRVKCKVLNQTAYPLQVVAWPRKVRYVDKGAEDGEDSDIVLTTHRGTAFENEVLPSGTIIMPEQKGDDGQGFEAGSMRKAHSLQHHSHRGWIYLDLVKPGGETAIHLQLYLQLTRHGIKHQTSVGRLDLDSNSENPQPSGVVGRVVYEKKGDSVTFVITPEVGDIQNMVDDSTKKPSLLLLGKGVETTTYVHHAGSRINLFVGREARYHEHTQRIAVDDGRGSTQHGRLGEIRHTQHEVEGTSSKFVGICSQYLGRETFKAHVKVHAVTGIVEMGKGYLANTLRTRAVFQDASDSGGEPHVLCYGFSDVGASRSDAIYAYVTRVHEGWLGALIEEDKRWLDVPFSKLALAGAHDAGMWEALNPGLLFVIENGPLAEGLSDSALLDLGTPVVRAMVRALQKIKFKPERALQNLANTQKDDTATLLRLGVRFFDFRPGYNFYDAVQAEKKEIRHQHAIVPGEEYISFLTSILRFLAKNAHEVVLVELKKDGFVLPEDKFDKQGKKVAISMIPSVQELRACLDQAYVAAGRPDIRAGCAGDLDASIGSLIERQTRLIIVDRVHDPHAWYRSDSYDPAAYGTDNPATIMAQLAITHGLSSKADDLDSSPKRGCIYQLQATPTGNMVDAVKSALTFSDASSLLVWMKAQQDRVTYPWIASTEFDEPGNVVFLNDFCDGALVDHAIDVCRRRAGLFGPAQRSTHILRSGSKRSAFLEQ